MIVINTLPRLDGNSDLIEKFVTEYLKNKKIDYEVLRLRNIKMGLPDHCLNCANGNKCLNIKDDMENKIIPKLLKHNKWLLILPTICGFSSSLFKIFTDRLSSLYNDKSIKYFHDLNIKAIIHGQVDNSWQVLLDWFKDYQSWTGLKSFNHISFVSSSNKGFYLPKDMIENFADRSF